MWCLATLLSVVLFIAFIASTRRINKDKVRSIFGESDTKHEEAVTNGEGRGEGGGVSTTIPEYVTEGGRVVGVVGEWVPVRRGEGRRPGRGFLRRSRGLSRTRLEASEYVTASVSTDECPPGSAHIADQLLCLAAADTLGLEYRGSKIWGNPLGYPHGCLHYSYGAGGTWYNERAGHRTHAMDAIGPTVVICKCIIGEEATCKQAITHHQGEGREISVIENNITRFYRFNKFDRVSVIENVDGKARHRWGRDGDSSFPLVREAVGTVNSIDSNGVVGVILDKDVEKEVRVHHTSLVKDDPPLNKTDNGARIEDVLNHFPRREDMAAFKCPITREIFRVPVVASDGRTYEMSALKEASNGAEPNVTNYRINSLLKDLAGKVVAQQILLKDRAKRSGWLEAASLEPIREASDEDYDDGAKGADRHPPTHIPAQTLDTTYKEIEQWKIQILNENPPALGAEAAWSFKCPISHDFFQDPVVASDGHTYEREMITQVLHVQGNALSPMTREPLSRDLFPNRAMKLLLSVLIQKAELLQKAEYAAEAAVIDVVIRK